MIDNVLIPLALRALRPFEKLQAWKVARAHRLGRFRRPADPILQIRRPRDIGAACVTTRRAA